MPKPILQACKYQADFGVIIWGQKSLIFMIPISRLTVVSRKAKKVQGERDYYCKSFTWANALVKWRNYYKQSLPKHG